MRPKILQRLALFGPGLLIAATGVGAGDLATAGFSGSLVGTAILWAVIVGAFVKFVLNEGLARWQLATGTTFLEGAVEHFGKPVIWVFLVYLFLWSFSVGSALMGACGVTMHAMVPAFEDAGLAKIVFGIFHSLLGLGLVLVGGFRLFEKLMGLCIGVMFVTVVVTAAHLWPDTKSVLTGLLVPELGTLSGENLSWTVALMGGVGGTLTILCYGYWIREKGRRDETALGVCRIDLGVGYAMTAVFGLAMVIIGSTVEVEGQGATLVVQLAEQLGVTVGPIAKWAFILGAWGAVFSSLFGVWQAVPYLFADIWGQIRRPSDGERSGRLPVDTKTPAYRIYLVLIAFVPMLGLGLSFKEVQKYYAVIGASFIPMLALALLLLNSRGRLVGVRLRNRWPTNVVLAATLAFFTWILWRKLEPLF